MVGEFPDYGFLLPHEVGHNMGCCHACGDGGGCGANTGAFSYSKGHRFPIGAPQWRTVMAYTPGGLIPHFSNPDVFFEGYPTGIKEGGGVCDPSNGPPSEADNARTIRETSAIVANFRENCGGRSVASS